MWATRDIMYIDAIQRMKLHDNIELTFKSGEIEQIYNVDCEAEWQFEKYAWQGTVTLTFDMVKLQENNK